MISTLTRRGWVRFAFLSLGALLSQACSDAGHARAPEPEELAVAAAANLTQVAGTLGQKFQAATGVRTVFSFASTAQLTQQIENGAPFDVLLSADIDYPRRLEESGQAERGSLYEYATGHIVLWTRNDSGIDVKRGLTVLTEARVRRVAIANPEHAPYGRAAVAALRHERLYERVQQKLVLGENISQAAQFAQTGSADVGLLALSLARSPALKSSGTYVEVPESWYPPIEQAAVVLASSRQKALARQFIEYLKRPASVRVLQSYGFAVPQATTR